jgi:DNA polymerase III sliding clamp (beta) subunit (PCNA family)
VAARTSRFSDFRATSFPRFRTCASTRVGAFGQGDLQKLISHTSFAVSTEESRPILNGVLWELKPDMMRMVATNGHRLAKMEMPIKSAGAPPCDLIVPPKALEQIKKLFPEDEDLEIAKGENHLGFRSPFTAVFTRLIEGPVSELRPGHSARQQSRRDRRSHCADKCVASYVDHRVGSNAPHPSGL